VSIFSFSVHSNTCRRAFIHSGCVVFGRVAGDTAAAYLLQRTQSFADKATSRLASVAGHIQTTVSIDPSANKVKLEFSWGDGDKSSVPPSTSTGPAADGTPSASGAGSAAEDTKTASSPVKSEGKSQAKSDALKEYTAEEVARHNTKEDCWVIVSHASFSPSFLYGMHPLLDMTNMS
jgi:hypothetical protein